MVSLKDLDALAKVDGKKIASEGFVFLLDYNENRMVEGSSEKDFVEDSPLLGKLEEHGDAMIYVGTIGEHYNEGFLRKAPAHLSLNAHYYTFIKCILLPFLFPRASATLWET